MCFFILFFLKSIIIIIIINCLNNESIRLCHFDPLLLFSSTRQSKHHKVDAADSYHTYTCTCEGHPIKFNFNFKTKEKLSLNLIFTHENFQYQEAINDHIKQYKRLNINFVSSQLKGEVYLTILNFRIK